MSAFGFDPEQIFARRRSRPRIVRPPGQLRRRIIIFGVIAAIIVLLIVIRWLLGLRADYLYLRERRPHQRLLDAADRPHRAVPHRVRDRRGALRRSGVRVFHGGGEPRPAWAEDRALERSGHRGARRDRRGVDPLRRVAGHPALAALGALRRHRPRLPSRLLVLRLHAARHRRLHGPALGRRDPRDDRGDRHGGRRRSR